MKYLYVILLSGGLVGAAGAAGTNVVSAKTVSGFVPEMKESVYAPESKRDPFFRASRQVTQTVGATATVQPAVSIPASAFRLQAILLGRQSPLALVNGEPMELNKPVKMVIGGSEVQVKAVEIKRERVVLEVEGQKVELRLEEPDSSPKLPK